MSDVSTVNAFASSRSRLDAYSGSFKPRLVLFLRPQWQNILPLTKTVAAPPFIGGAVNLRRGGTPVLYTRNFGRPPTIPRKGEGVRKWVSGNFIR